MAFARSIAAPAGPATWVAALLSVVVIGGGGAGCGGGAGKVDPATAAKLVTLAELDQLDKAFADRFVLLVASACDQIERDNPSQYQRRKAHELKLYCAISAFDIASNADPYSALLDLTLAATLVSQVWIDEDRAEGTFGPERARVLIAALRRARVEIWEIAAKALKPEHLDTLDYLIWEWRRQNPDVEHVEFVRFDNFAASRGKSQLADVRTGGGFLAPVNEARRAMDEARLFAERAFYISKRAPITLSWQAQALANDLLAEPEVALALRNWDSMTASTHRMNEILDRIPKDMAAERVAILAAIDDREKVLNSTIANIRAAIADTQKMLVTLDRVVGGSEKVMVELRSTSVALTDTIKAADALTARYAEPKTARPPTVAPRGSPAGTSQPTEIVRAGNGVNGGDAVMADSAMLASAGMSAAAGSATPVAIATTAPANRAGFDIRDYADTAGELARAAREMRLLVESTQGLVASEAWSRRVQEFNNSADERMRVAMVHSQTLVDDVFRRVGVTIGIIFLLVLVLRLISGRLKRHEPVPVTIAKTAGPDAEPARERGGDGVERS